MCYEPLAARRRGLAPVELVLWLPVLLMVMALIVNYANMTSWRLRGEAVARDAVWRARWPRSGNAEPRPSTNIWPTSAGMAVHGDTQMSQLNHPDIDQPVVRGPVLQYGDPPRSFQVTDALDQEKGAVRGVSSIVRELDLLPALGPYRSGEIADRMLTSQWQCAERGYPNRYRRTLVLYELPQTAPGLPEAYVRSVIDLLGIPHYYALSVLDRDEDWRIFHGSYPHFYPQIAANYGETDPAVVHERSVLPMIDHYGPDGWELGRISLLPRRMTEAYLAMYKGVRQEIEDLEQELISVPPPNAVRRAWILNRLAQLRQIQDLDLKIQQLERDLATLDSREERMKAYSLRVYSGG